MCAPIMTFSLAMPMQLPQAASAEMPSLAMAATNHVTASQADNKACMHMPNHAPLYYLIASSCNRHEFRPSDK